MIMLDVPAFPGASAIEPIKVTLRSTSKVCVKTRVLVAIEGYKQAISNGSAVAPFLTFLAEDFDLGVALAERIVRGFVRFSTTDSEVVLELAGVDAWHFKSRQQHKRVWTTMEVSHG